MTPAGANHMKRNAILLIALISSVLLVGTGFAAIQFETNSTSRATFSYDVIISNEQIQLMYTDEAVGVGNYTKDTAEPRGWELFPSLFWDSNGDTLFDASENIASTLFPLVHFTVGGQNYNFCPIHQSILQQPGDAEIVSSGWISSPNVYASEVKDANEYITLKSTISIYDGDNYFTQTIDIKSTTASTVSNIDLMEYLGVDINGFFDDYAFIDTDNNNMLKAKDNTTGVWFGAYPTAPDDSYEINIWDDGPSAHEDLWEHCLSNYLNGQDTISGDVEGALGFSLPDITVQGGIQTITIYYSFGHNENDLYPATPNNQPMKPIDPDPINGASNVEVSPILSVYVSDPDGDTMEVRFYNASDNSLIGTETDVASGTQASITWSGLSYETTYYWYAVADDGEYTNQSETWEFTTESKPILCGDANGDEIVNVSDAVYIINYVFVPGSPAPNPLCIADANGDGIVNVSDVVYIVNYVFIPGFPDPVTGCCDPSW